MKRQILDGIRLVCIISVVVGSVFTLFDGELRTARAIQSGSFSAGVMGFGELMAVGLLLWLTVGMWARAVAAVSFLGALKGIAGLITGAALSPPSQPLFRMAPIEMIAVLLLAGLLTMRFANSRPEKLEKIGLVIFVFSITSKILWESLHAPIIVGLISLLAPRLGSVCSVRESRSQT